MDKCPVETGGKRSVCNDEELKPVQRSQVLCTSLVSGVVRDCGEPPVRFPASDFE